MIHQVDGRYVISSHQVWLPGVYDSERTARWAFRFPDQILTELQNRVNVDPDPALRVITFADLRQARRDMTWKKFWGTLENGPKTH